MASSNYSKVRNIHLAAAAIATGIHILPTTVFIDHIKSILQRNDHGRPMPLTPKIKQLYNEVLDDMNASNETRQSLEPIFTSGSTPSHVGYIGPNLKCLLCIPETFEFVDMYDVPFSPLDWILKIDVRLEVGKDGRDAFVLSKKAQKYALAREIWEAEDQRNWIFPILPALAIGHNFAWLRKFYLSYYKYLEYSKWWKRSIFGVVGLLSACFYFFIKDSFNFVIENKADEYASIISQEYIEGGVEYWEKNLWRNRIIRSHMPYLFIWRINKDGDFTQYFTRKHVPIANRKKYLEDLLAMRKVVLE